MRILAIIGGGLFGAVYGFFSTVLFLWNTPIFDGHSYRGANDWGGLEFLLNPPIAALLFLGIFAWIIFAAKSSRGTGLSMAAGVLAATMVAMAVTRLVAPARYSLPGGTSDLFILSWAVLAFLLAWLAKRFAAHRP